MLDDLKTYCMAFIQLIQTNPARKSGDFNMELTELVYDLNGLRAVYKDTHRNQIYDVYVTSRDDSNYRYLPETL